MIDKFPGDLNMHGRLTVTAEDVGGGQTHLRGGSTQTQNWSVSPLAPQELFEQRNYVNSDVFKRMSQSKACGCKKET